jgi:DUF1680 family protein
MTRRAFVTLTAAAAGVWKKSGRAAQIGSSAASRALKLRSKLEPVLPQEIALRPGLVHTRFELHRKRLKAIPPEDILMPFFRAHGLPTTGKELNGDCENHCQTGPGAWPGLQSTYWFSGAAATARWGHDEELRQTLVRMTEELARTREPDGFLLASPTGLHRWDDHYSLTSRTRSMIRGLTDIYEATGESLALELARGQADSLWREVQTHRVPEGKAYVRLGGAADTRLTPLAHRLTYLDFISANFKLPPALALLYLHTGEAQYAELASLCIDETLVNRLAANAPGDDPLAGRHAYLTMDLLYGMHLLGQLTGNEKYVTAAANAWNIIAGKHLFVTGGMGSRELWVNGIQSWQFPETANAQETCAAAHWMVYNHIMLQWSGAAVHADHIETTLYNDLLAAQDPQSGDVTYFLNLTGKDKLYDPPPRFGRHCCEGNHMFALGTVPGMIYGKAGQAVTVNLYIPSVLTTWTAAGNEIRLEQETDYPAGGRIVISVGCARPQHFAIHLRIPGWCTQTPRLQVNKSSVSVTAAPGAWQPVEREWKNGDRIELDLPMGPYVLRQALSNVSRVALRWGPLILAGTWEDGLPLAQDPPLPEFQLRSRANRIPYVPSLFVKSGDPREAWRKTGTLRFEASAAPATVIHAAEGHPPEVLRPHNSRVPVRFVPFYEVTRGKYSIWFPAVLES